MFERVAKFFVKKAETKKLVEEVNETTIDETVEEDYSDNLEIVLCTLKDEFEREQSRAEKLDNRIGVLLAACVAILTIILQSFEVKGLLKKSPSNIQEIILNVLPLVLILFSVIFIIYSCILLLGIISPKPYNSIDYNKIIKVSSLNKAEIYKEILTGYKSALDVNANINENKMKTYIKSIRCIFISSALFSINSIFMTFITL